MDDSQTILFNVLTEATAVVCIVGFIFLLLRGRHNRVRRILAYIFLLWGLASIGRLVFIHLGQTGVMCHPFRPVGIIGGNVFITFILLFPLEVVYPGWLNWKRFLKLLLPIILLSTVFFLVMALTGENVEVFNDLSEMSRSIKHFNVWFRLPMLISTFIYVIVLMRLIFMHEKKYHKWRNENFADVDTMDISWMRYFILFTGLIIFGWMLNVFIACIWCFIVHTVVTLVSFSFFLYKGLFHESAYPEDFFADAGGKVEKLLSSESVVLLPETTVVADEVTDASFKSKMPVYVESLKNWMEQERPYLYKDFKLTDVGRQLPLNRSYLSRLFNEGFGKNFSEVVRSYRVEYAKEVLSTHPEFSLQTVAGLCGFSSDSTFIRAFRILTGMTPSQYRSGRYNN